MTEIIIQNYRELNNPPLRICAEVALEDAAEVHDDSSHYMDSGLEGDIHTRVYYANKTVMVVRQNHVTRVAEWREGDVAEPGWRERTFRLAGEKEGVASLVNQLISKGIKLESMN